MNLSDIFVSTGAQILDRTWVRKQIHLTYWGSWRTDEIIDASLDHSLCVGLYWRDPDTGGPNHPEVNQQIGFARIVTDYASFSWLCDVIIDPDHRGMGYGKFLMSQLIELPEIKKCVTYLATKDAQTFYERFGFTLLGGNRVMRRIPNKS